MVNLLLIPLEISFRDFHVSRSFEVINRIYFLLDYAVQLNTAHYKKGVLITDRKEIICNFLSSSYVRESLALYAIMSARPFGHEQCRWFFLLKLTGIFSIIKTYRQSYLINKKYNFVLNYSILLLEVIFICHWFSCFWNHLGNIEEDVSNSDNSWVRQYGMADQPFKDRYIFCIYYSIITLCTIGYGDITPQNTTERAFIGVAALLSSGMFAYILNKINQIISQSNQQTEEFNNKMLELNQLLITSKVSHSTQQKARQYLEYLYCQKRQSSRMNIQIELSQFPQLIREQIQKEIYSRMIHAIPFLQTMFSRKFLEQLALRVREANYGPNELIFSQDEVQKPKLYYINQGEVELFIQTSAGQQLGHVKSLQVLGKEHHFGQEEFILQNHHKFYSARSKGITNIHYICLADFLQLLTSFQPVHAHRARAPLPPIQRLAPAISGGALPSTLPCTLDGLWQAPQHKSIIYVFNFNSFTRKDKEQYHQIKEQVSEHIENYKVKVGCVQCKSCWHTLAGCPYVFYSPNRQQVINGSRQVETNFRNSFIRKRRRHKEFFQKLDGVQYRLYQFLENLGDQVTVVQDEGSAFELGSQKNVTMNSIISQDDRTKVDPPQTLSESNDAPNICHPNDLGTQFNIYPPSETQSQLQPGMLNSKQKSQ